MNLVIVHHHLNRGGVTQVILNHLRALRHAGVDGAYERIVVVYGGRRTGWPEASEPALERVELEVVPSIDYDSVVSVEADTPYQDMLAMLKRRSLSPELTLLHVHNHTLGKNVAWPAALSRLAADGYRMLLQLHDFAEDFRPENYRHQVAFYENRGTSMQEVYFQAPHVDYAVLNSRDRTILRSAGFAGEKLAWLPNPVHSFPELPDRIEARRKLREVFDVAPEERYILYPVRGIRRKNVGELVLWSAIAPGPTTFGITLAPLNPAELAPYEQWEALAEELQLPCKFDVGGNAGLSFSENLAAADAIINTSVAEGFGLVFLEAWLTGNLLIGRDLPEISADFKAAGLQLDTLADALWVPRRSPIGQRELFSEANYRQRIEELFDQVLTDFGQPALGVEAIQQQLDERLAADWIDFALLTVEAQTEVIRAAAGDRELADAIVEKNAHVMRPLCEHEVDYAATIQANAEIVLSRFSLKETGERLHERYELLQGQEPGPVTALRTADQILQEFVKLERLHPVRLESV
ncbi:hypothetical protein GC197_14120 [bacterium]|nr:hypothetical protein [bacterium]